MKKIYFSILFLCLSLAINAQTFTATGNVPIIDNSVCYMSVGASGLPSSMNNTFGISSVCINLTHTYDGDIKIFLISPQQDSIMLSGNNGGGGDNYTNTCFTAGGANGFIHTATNLPPYTGSYTPEYSLNMFNSATHNPNGVWKIMVKDEVASDAGVLLSVSITFSANPPQDPPPPPGPCGFNAVGNCHCPDGSTDCDLLPDMTSSAAIIMNNHTEYPGQITLSNATPNIGWGPMEIHGVDTCFCGTTMVPCSTAVCPNGTAVKQMVKQTVYHKNGNTMSSTTRTAGTMSYHPTHGHVHVDSWADFSLRTATADPNPLNWPIVGTGSKVSFCLINLGDCTNNLGYCVGNNGNTLTMDSIPNSPLGNVSGCGVDQGIYTGKLDIYSQGMVGMSINFGDICNGNYYIVSITDPDNWFLEQDETNNWVAVPITLTDQHPAPFANFAQNVNVQAVALAGDTANASNFWWDFGDGSPIDSTSLIVAHNYSANGSYIVSFHVENSCGTKVKTDTVYITTVGIKSLENNNTSFFKVAPNPFNNSTEISYYLMNGTETSIEFFDVVGNKVETIVTGYQSAGNYKFNFNPTAKGLSKGTYIVKYTSSDKINFARLVFE